MIVSGRMKGRHAALWMNGTGGGICQVIFSPDGHYVAAGCVDGLTYVWEARTGLMLTKLIGHAGGVYTLTYSPNGRHLVSGSTDCTVRIWDMDTGMATGEPLVGHKSPVNSVSFSPDGRFIASYSGDLAIKIWDLGQRTELRQMKGFSREGQVVYCPDGLKIAFCGEEGIGIRDTVNGTSLCKTDRTARIRCIAYSPNGEYLVSGGDDSIVRLWSAGTLNELAMLKGHFSYVRAVVFSSDGSEFLSASQDTTMLRWGTTSRQMAGAPIRAHGASILSAAYSPDGRFIASGSLDNSVRFWDAKTVSQSSTAQLLAVRSISCSSDGTVFASAGDDAKIRIHDVNSGNVLRTLSGHTDTIYAVAFNPNGNLLASASRDCTIRLWNAETGIELHRFVGHTDSVMVVVFKLDGKHVISASFDKTVRQWPIRTENNIDQVLFSQNERIFTLSLSPDGSFLASGAARKSIRFSRLENGLEIGEPCRADARVRALDFSADGKYIVSGCEDFAIQIFNVDDRMKMNKLTGHNNWVLSVAFSHNGRQLVSASGDWTVRQWDFETGVELRCLAGHTHVVWCVVYTIDQKRIISASHDGTVRIWNSDVAQSSYVPAIDQELSSLVLTDGWITSSKGELLLWVPPEYRNGIRDMCEICVPADAPGHPVRLDWSKLVKGNEWTGILRERKE